MNFSNIASKDFYEDSQISLGFVGGVKYDLLISGRILVGADLLYNQLGFNESMIFTDINGNPVIGITLKSSYDYISLPIKFGYVFGNKFTFIPKIGLQTSYLLSAKLTSPMFDSNGNVIGTEDNDIKENTSNTDLAVFLETEFCYGFNENF